MDNGWTNQICMFFRSLTTHTLTNSHICSPVCALCCYALSHDKNSKIERGKRRWRQMNDGVAIGASNQTAETILGYGLMASEHIEQCRLCAKNSKMNAKSTFTANGTKIASKNRNRSVILSHSLSLSHFTFFLLCFVWTITLWLLAHCTRHGITPSLE